MSVGDRRLVPLALLVRIPVNQQRYFNPVFSLISTSKAIAVGHISKTGDSRVIGNTVRKPCKALSGGAKWLARPGL
jgi:hypothetical protein